MAELENILAERERSASGHHRRAGRDQDVCMATLAARSSSMPTSSLSIEDLIADEEVAITVTKAGYIKRTPVSTYSRQGRGGKGRLGATAKNEDFVEHLFTHRRTTRLMIFTDDGQVFKMKVHEIPEAATAARGKAVVNWSSYRSERKLVATMAGPRFYRGSLSDDGHKERCDQKIKALRHFKTSGLTASTPSTSTKATSCSR